MKKEAGFTLIEIIVTLILVGILASFAGFGIVTAVKGYIFAKNNTIIAGKAQVALQRMTRELLELRDTPHPPANPSSSIVFDKVFETVAIGQSGSGIRIAKGNAGTTPAYANGDILMDQVTTGGLSFAYKKGSVDWTSSDDITALSHIVISLTVSGAGEGNNFTFNTTVSPRNNGNAGGTPPPTPSTPPPIASGRCFVATAAYGNPFHPMVLLLKQFRDQCIATWSGGRALIQFYYKEGPYLAEIIQDKPWACALVRVLLLPFVGLSFLLVYARGSIPLVILIIIAGIWLIQHYRRRSIFMKKSIATHHEKGSALIVIIFTMVIMSLLGAAMVSLTSTSGLSQAYGSVSQKAYYLAESGFRYTASEFLNVADSENNGINENQNSKANDLNGRTLTLTEGSIHLNVTPFHYATSAAAAVGATTLTVQFSGGSPAFFAIPSTGSIQIVTQTRPNSTTAYTTYTDTYNYTGFSGSTFTLSTPLVRAVPAWTSVTVIARPSSSQTITPNPNPTLTTNRLTLTKPAAGFFMPARNGKFKITGNPFVYKYDYRDNVNSTALTTTLYGVCNSQVPTSSTPFSVTPTSSIIPNDFFTVASTGTAGGTSRTLTFITPVDLTGSSNPAGPKTTYADTFQDKSNWQNSVAGTHGTANSAGGEKSGDTSGRSALLVTGSTPYGAQGGCSGGGNDMAFSLITLNWRQDYANFYSARLAKDNTLSYDAQVKMKLPQANNYYMAGLLFRLNMVTDLSSSSWLGVSFLRGRNGESNGNDRDGIEDGIVPVVNGTPVNNTPMIVLWRKNTGQDLTGAQWIAYKIIANKMNFDNGQAPLFVDGANSYFIRGGTSGARADVTSVSTTDGGVTGSFGFSRIYSAFQETEELFQLVLQSGVDARVQTPISSTSIKYDRGSAAAIQIDDIIRGQSSNARARVTSVTRESYNPIIPWGTYYRGVITITETEGVFSNYEYLDVYRPNASHSAHFVALDDLLSAGTGYVKEWSTLLLRIEEKVAASGEDFSGQYVNDIKIYTGDIDQHGTPTGSPLDVPKYANKRWGNPLVAGDVQWPPDAGWSTVPLVPSMDHFTLVQGWVFNPALTSSFVLRPATAEEPSSTIRTNTFTTHGITSFAQQELGLTTAGQNMTNNTYFDDFGVQLEGGTTGGQTGFSTPLMY